MSLQSTILTTLTGRAMEWSVLRAALPESSQEALYAAVRALVKSGAIVFRCGCYELVKAAVGVEKPLPPRRAPIATGQPLTAREEEVRELAAEGLTAAVIARELGMAEKSVHRHLTQVYRKLGVRGRGELVGVAPQNSQELVS